MMTLTPQIRKIAIKKKASHLSSIREPNIVFRNLVNNLEQAKIILKLEETKNLKLQYVNNIHTTTSQINHANFCRRFGYSIAACRQNQQDNQNKPQKYREQNKSFYQYMKKDQKLPNKNFHSNNSSGKPLPDNYKTSREQSTYRNNYRGRSPDRRN